MQLKVAIIGAGPAGAALAKILLDAGVSVVVFEAKSTLRVEGGSLKLRTDTGVAAMKKAGLYDEFLKCARFDGESLQVTDKRFVHLYNQQGWAEKTSKGRPEIDLAKLMQILIDSLPSDTIKWGYKVQDIDEDMTVYFEDGPNARGFDLVVGADGAWSKTRSCCLKDAKEPVYSGIGGYGGYIPDAETNAPDTYRLMRRGTVLALSNYRLISGQQMGDGRLRFGAWHRAPEAQPAWAGSAKMYVREHYKDWSPQLLDIAVNEKASGYVWQSLYMLPVGHRWTHRPGVTLLGDAAHLMMPLTGDGWNMALEDGMKLADAIVKAQAESTDGRPREVLCKHVRQFEEEMFERAGKMQQVALDVMHCIFYTPGAPWTSLDRCAYRLLSTTTTNKPVLLLLLLRCVVYAYFFWIKLRKAPSREALQWDFDHPPPMNSSRGPSVE